MCELTPDPPGPCAVLSFDSRQVKVPSSLGVEGLHLAVEEHFGLNMKSYSFFDAHGPVQGPALLRAIAGAAPEHPCQLVVCENPEWRKMREMDMAIRALTAHAPKVDTAMQALEARVMAAVEDRISVKVTAMLSGVEGHLANLTEKVHRVIAPMTKNIAMEQIDTRARLESLEQLRSDAKLDALDMNELNAKFDDLNEACAAALANASPVGGAMVSDPRLAEELLGAREDLEELRLVVAEKSDILDVTRANLRDELRVVRQSAEHAQEGVEALRQEVKRLDGERAATSPSKGSLSHGIAGGPDARFQWPDGGRSELLPLISPGKSWRTGLVKVGAPDLTGAMPTRYGESHPIQRSGGGSRSLPQLRGR